MHVIYSSLNYSSFSLILYYNKCKQRLPKLLPSQMKIGHFKAYLKIAHFTMSRHVSLSFLKNYSRKFQHFNLFNRSNHLLLPGALPAVNIAQKQSSSPAGSIVAGKQLQPFLNQPVEEVLSIIQEGEVFTAGESVSLLKALRIHALFNGVNARSFRDDSRFRDICTVFEQNCHRITPNLLVSGLRSLLEVGLPATSTYIVAAERSILRSVNNFSAFNLIGCLYYHHKFVETNLQKRVVEELVHALHRRVHEIASSSEVLMLVHFYHLLQDDRLKIIEIKIVELLPLLKTQEVCRLLCTIGEKSIRNVPILEAAAFRLLQEAKKPDLKKTVDILYVFKKLNFYDPCLYSHLLNHLPSEIPSVQEASLISGLLTVCGHLRWRHSGILEACGEWIKDHFDSCRNRELISFVMTMAALNYCTANTETMLHLIVPHLTPDSMRTPSVMLDVVWSLAILKSVPKELLLKVLSRDFYKSLAGDSQTTRSNHLKLLNLKGILRKKYPECVFSCDLYLEPIKLTENPTIESCRQHVLRVLSNFAPEDKFLCTNQVTDTGIFIDAELIMDKSMKPLLLQEYGILAKPESTSKELPKDSKRIALLIMFHKDVALSTSSLTGVNALGVRLLSDAGYTVVTILYDEYSENKTELQKAKYLMERIKNCVIGTS